VQTKPQPPSFTISAVLCAALTVGLLALSHAEDIKYSPHRYWTCTGTGPNGGPLERLCLGVADGELWGSLTERTAVGDPHGTPFYHGRIKGAEISFTVVSTLDGGKTTSKYSGKIAGDTIKGKVEISRGREITTQDWSAKREAAKKKS
jgi:hypothetical protein